MGIFLNEQWQDAGMRQGDVAGAAHVAQSFVSNISRGQVRPSLEKWLRICAVSDTTLSETIIRAEIGDATMTRAQYRALQTVINLMKEARAEDP